MVGQNTDRDGLERAILLNGSIDTSESFDLIDQQIAPAVGKDDGEKEHAAFDLRSEIFGHNCSYVIGPWWARQRIAHPHAPLALPTLRRLS
jgi:hypothetical protein